MLFRSRKPKTLGRRLLEFFWPRGGFRRSTSYIWHRVARLPGSTHAVAAGFASGAAVSFTPFMGLHFIMGFIVAFITRGNLIASAIGTAIGNPWTFPFIFAVTGAIGSWMLGGVEVADLPTPPEFAAPAFLASPGGWLGAAVDYMVQVIPGYLQLVLDVAWPYIIGGIPASIAVWLIFYFALRYAITGYRKRRDERRARRAAARAAALDALESHAQGEDVTPLPTRERRS